MITFRKLGRFGRLGNQLFQYAGTRIYAESNGFRYTFPAWPGNNFFENIPQSTFLDNIKTKFLPTAQLDDVVSYGKIDKIKYLAGLKKKLLETINISELYEKPRDNISLYGYLQDDFSLNLLNDNKKAIKEWFTFKNHINNSYQQLIKKPFIGMHIRRGDLVKRNLTVPIDGYVKTLNKIRNGRDLFIATDDRTLLSELGYLDPLAFKNPLPEIPDYIFDFWMLKNAETVIGGGSTFSWWASFLGTGDYYSPPLNHLWEKQ